MKNFAITLVWLTSFYVFVFAGFSQTDIQLPIIMGLYFIGILLVFYMVYTVLKDKYTTNKTFKDWYGDHPEKTHEEK